MAQAITKESTYEQISDIVQIKLMKDFMESKMEVDEFRSVSRGLSDLFSQLHWNLSMEKVKAPEIMKTNYQRAGKLMDISV